jgi:hypothetical protein
MVFTKPIMPPAKIATFPLILIPNFRGKPKKTTT